MEKMFIKYPIIEYNDVAVRDITTRVKIDSKTKNDPNLFYPVELKSGIRPDIIADAYYQDSELDWLIYLANDIVDPYYQWYLDSDQFEQMIINKYQSIENALKKIKYYRTNWAVDDRQITPSFYDNTLVPDQKQYYSPIFGPSAKIIGYQRKQQDWIRNTNMIATYQLSYQDQTRFSNGELLDLKYGANNTGTAEVITSNSTAMIIQHTAGNTVANSTLTLTFVGETTNCHATSNSYSINQTLITNAESSFWHSVSYFDWENQLNQARKHIRIINANYAADVAEQFRQTAKG